MCSGSEVLGAIVASVRQDLFEMKILRPPLLPLGNWEWSQEPALGAPRAFWCMLEFESHQSQDADLYLHPAKTLLRAWMGQDEVKLSEKP